MAHLFLAFAAILLIAVVTAQNILVPSLRNSTISAGLTGPYHWWLDGSYVVLSTALCYAFRGYPLQEALAVFSAVMLILVGITNTFHVAVDRITRGQHSLWHSRFTAAVFVGSFLLELAGSHGALWWLAGAGIASSLAIYFLAARSDYAEKLAVLGICLWLAAC